jgi:hypothetical protein
MRQDEMERSKLPAGCEGNGEEMVSFDKLVCPIPSCIPAIGHAGREAALRPKCMIQPENPIRGSICSPSNRMQAATWYHTGILPIVGPMQFLCNEVGITTGLARDTAGDTQQIGVEENTAKQERNCH